jgi:hypothetical protein
MPILKLTLMGQRPRNALPADPTPKGSNPGGVAPVLRPAAQGYATPSGSMGRTSCLSGALPPAIILRPCRARGWRMSRTTSSAPAGRLSLPAGAEGEERCSLGLRARGFPHSRRQSRVESHSFTRLDNPSSRTANALRVLNQPRPLLNQAGNSTDNPALS